MLTLLVAPLVCALVPLMLGWEQRAPTDKLHRNTQQHLVAVACSSKIIERLEAATVTSAPWVSPLFTYLLLLEPHRSDVAILRSSSAFQNYPSKYTSSSANHLHDITEQNLIKACTSLSYLLNPWPWSEPQLPMTWNWKIQKQWGRCLSEERRNISNCL